VKTQPTTNKREIKIMIIIALVSIGVPFDDPVSLEAGRLGHLIASLVVLNHLLIFSVFIAANFPWTKNYELTKGDSECSSNLSVPMEHSSGRSSLFVSQKLAREPHETVSQPVDVWNVHSVLLC
jgi:hypothetical protein